MLTMKDMFNPENVNSFRKTKGVRFSEKPYYLPAGLAADFEDNNGNHFLMIEERNYEEED